MPYDNFSYSFGSSGTDVELVQLALSRSGLYSGTLDGVFDIQTQKAVDQFQFSRGLPKTGVVDSVTFSNMLPLLKGYTVIRAAQGDSFCSIASAYNSSAAAISAANPNLSPDLIPANTPVTVPFSFNVVCDKIRFSSRFLSFCVDGLLARYPFLSYRTIGKSVMGKPLHCISAGCGNNVVLYIAAHHANEWMTSIILMKFLEDISSAFAQNADIAGFPASELFSSSKIVLIPMLNPDGVDLAAGALSSGPFFMSAKDISSRFPAIPFPQGWKANIRGTDLNLNYPAQWDTAEKIKYSLGFSCPAPRDFVGANPLSEPESRALYDFTRSLSPSLVLAYHSQGEVIYWKFLNSCSPSAYSIAKKLSSVSGYSLDDAPYSSSFAGFKDWFIQDFDRPAYTVEVGLGSNPLPLSLFPKIYSDNLPLLLTAALPCGRP
ncbi:MAG: peptidoglycan-binding protein [Oscillospiraceae bacterium]|nr:peptidoglycan-binding protein [Oscillospiraceae bacterium]